MSVAEIIDEVRRMTPQERIEIARALLALSVAEESSAAPTFADAKAYVFDNYGELLKRLAQ